MLQSKQYQSRPVSLAVPNNKENFSQVDNLPHRHSKAGSSLPKPGLPLGESIKQAENEMLLRNYSGVYLQQLRKIEHTKGRRFLSRHGITVQMRAKMVDWMIEVISAYKFSEATFFTSVRVMDNYFDRAAERLETSQLHKLGVTSMFIASKYEEIYPFKMSVLYEKIAHKKIEKSEILRCQQEVLKDLAYSIPGESHFDIAEFIVLSSLKEIGEATRTSLRKAVLYLSKLVIHDYEIMNDFTPLQLAGGVLFVAFRIMEQVEKGFKTDSRCKQICSRLGISEKTVTESASKVLQLAKSFQKLHPTLNNLKKFNGFSFGLQ